MYEDWWRHFSPRHSEKPAAPGLVADDGRFVINSVHLPREEKLAGAPLQDPNKALFCHDISFSGGRLRRRYGDRYWKIGYFWHHNYAGQNGGPCAGLHASGVRLFARRMAVGSDGVRS